MNKYYYYEKSLEELEKIKNLNYKPKLLLHACCAPCSAFPLEFLSKYFKITIYYNNSNIYPEEEFIRRLNELKEFLRSNYQEVDLIVPEYDNITYNKMLEKFGDMPEGRQRCFTCYSFRMNKAYKFANENNFDYFTTVMTISRQKNSQKLNEIGSKLEKQYPKVKYFYSDFKKKKGIDRANEISKENDMYRQDYCGCIYSYNKRKDLDTKYEQ